MYEALIFRHWTKGSPGLWFLRGAGQVRWELWYSACRHFPGAAEGGRNPAEYDGLIKLKHTWWSSGRLRQLQPAGQRTGKEGAVYTAFPGGLSLKTSMKPNRSPRPRQQLQGMCKLNIIRAHTMLENMWNLTSQSGELGGGKGMTKWQGRIN